MRKHKTYQESHRKRASVDPIVEAVGEVWGWSTVKPSDTVQVPSGLAQSASTTWPSLEVLRLPSFSLFSHPTPTTYPGRKELFMAFTVMRK